MPWTVRFLYDVDLDAVHASFANCVLADGRDVEQWEREVSRRLASFGRKVDLLIDLTGLMVKPSASAAFGEARTRTLERYTLRSFRYGADRSTRTSVFTSAAIHGAAANVYPTREAAVAALIAARAKP
jgi:hypothetical protein